MDDEFARVVGAERLRTAVQFVLLQRLRAQQQMLHADASALTRALDACIAAASSSSSADGGRDARQLVLDGQWLCLHCIHSADDLESAREHASSRSHWFAIDVNQLVVLRLPEGRAWYSGPIVQLVRSVCIDWLCSMANCVNDDAQCAKRIAAAGDARGARTAVPTDWRMSADFSTPRGLYNLGNTCFMNGPLQILLNLRPLQRFLLADGHSYEACRRAHGGNTQVCLACEYDFLLSQVVQAPIAQPPHRMLAAVRTCMPAMASDDQQDAHEFLLLLLDHIASGMLTSSGVSVVEQLFASRLRSDLMCNKCEHVSTSFERCMDISLALHGASGQVHRLADMLREHVSAELLDDVTLGACPHCIEPPSFTKQISYQTLPPVVCLHVKRFRFDATMQEKLHDLVVFPEDGLDLSVITSRSVLASRVGLSSAAVDDAPLLYDLYGIIVHLGDIDKGHYIAYVRCGKQWYKCDDSVITKVDRSAALGCQAYVLFYVRSERSSALS